MKDKQKNWAFTGYQIPGEINPEENICVCVPVPKDWGHIRAFLGQMTELSKWLTWEKDGTDSAARAARRWFEITECVAKEIDCIMSSDCGCGDEKPTNTRINPDTGAYEVSYDDGETWVSDTGSDPRSSGLIFPDLPGSDGGEKKCAAANSIIGFLEETQQAELAQLVANATIADMIAALIGVAATIGLVFGALPGAILGFFSFVVHTFGHMIAGDFEAQFTTATWDELLCILFCNMEDDGSFTEAQWQVVKNQCVSEITGYAGYWLHDHINLFGVVGLTNAARASYPGSRDCDSCDCPIECGDPSGITYGTVIEDGVGVDGRKYLIVESVEYPGGSYNVVAWGEYGTAVPPNICCYLYAEVPIVNDWLSTEWTDCDGGLHTAPAPEGRMLGHAVYYNDSNNFTIKLIFGA